MRKFFLLIFLFLTSHFSKAQKTNTINDNLFEIADSLFGVKNYINSALVYSTALRQAGDFATAVNRWNAASSWAMAGFTDSAFQQLNIIATSNKIGLLIFPNIYGDKNFNSLRNDVRWKEVMDKLFKQGQKKEIDILSGIKIKLRDGIHLNATVYKPHLQKEALPVIFTLTPYMGDNYHEHGVYFAQHDYVYVTIDERGRGGSEGEFEPFFNDTKDGYDIVEWLAKLSYSNGKIAMWGGSYGGTDQWLTAKALPPHLRSIVPTASPKAGYTHPYLFNIGYSYMSKWLMFTGSKTHHLNLFNDDKYSETKFIERYVNDLPFASLDSLIGYPNKIWKKYMTHQALDAYYKSMNPDSSHYRKMKFPILIISGQFDINKSDILFYEDFMKYASSEAKNNLFLILGPWSHSGTRKPVRKVNGLTLGDSALVDMNDFHWQWYNYTLKDSVKPTLLRNNVMYFVTNRNTWKSAATLQDIGKEKMKLFLNSFHSEKKPLLDSAILQEEISSHSKPAVYVYDPLDKTENNGSITYNSSPFKNDTEVSGIFQLDLFIETNVKDVDISAEIFEIKADSRSILLTNHMIRARYRESLEKEKLLLPGENNIFQFKNFNFISRIIEKGSRLQLVISSPNSQDYQKNYCSGGNVANETARDAHVATIKIYNDSKHPSVLYVPIMR